MKGGAAKVEDCVYSLNVQRFTSLTKLIATISEVERILTSMMTSDRETVKVALAGTPHVEQKGGSNTKEASRVACTYLSC